MPINLIDVSKYLDDKGIQMPKLRFLTGNKDKYKIAHLQPAGRIKIEDEYVGFWDKADGEIQTNAFLDEAIRSGTDVAIAPEYCVSLKTVKERLLEGKLLEAGKLWVLGMEAISLQNFREFVDVVQRNGCAVLHEIPASLGQKKFIDALFYVFRTKKKSGEEIICILVQIKTEVMGSIDFETKNLFVGPHLFVFNLNRTHDKDIRLLSLICSDALATDTNSSAFWEAILEKCIVIHIQLNPNPRSPNFRTYRDLAFKLEGADTSDIICVNWSRKVDSQPESLLGWKGLCGSAFYTKSESTCRDEGIVEKNHSLGLYVTYRKDFKVFCMYFNYLPGIFVYSAHKVISGALKVHNIRTAPEMESFLEWDAATRRFSNKEFSEDGFSEQCIEISGEKLSFLTKPTYLPLAVERLLALSKWEVGETSIEGWDSLTELRSFGIDGEEIVIRPTVVQDPHGTATSNRREMISTLSTLATQVLATPRNSWPSCLANFPVDSELQYRKMSPFRNLHSNQHSATIVYLGNNPPKEVQKQTLRQIISALYSKKQDHKLFGLWCTKDGRLICINKGIVPTVTDDTVPRFDDILEVGQ